MTECLFDADNHRMKRKVKVQLVRCLMCGDSRATAGARLSALVVTELLITISGSQSAEENFRQKA
jgi:phosphoribosyl-dephospho-CoA transferase